jgi:hypothetical protein
MSNPDAIREDIERTRGDLREDVAALEDKVSPSRAAQRGKERVRGQVTHMRESLMGSAEHGQAQAQDAVRGAPDGLRRQTQGNPLAMGLVAFALGWLASSLIPPSRPERRVGATLREQSAERTQSLGESARRVAEDVKEPLQRAAHEVGEQFRDSAQQVTEEAKQSASREAEGQR